MLATMKFVQVFFIIELGAAFQSSSTPRRLVMHASGTTNKSKWNVTYNEAESIDEMETLDGPMETMTSIVEDTLVMLPTIKSERADADVSEQVDAIAKGVLVPATMVLILAMAAGHVCESKRLPESAVIVFVALFLGLAIRYAISVHWIRQTAVSFLDASLLSLVFMPIITFDAGWSIQVADFMSQFEYVMIFALPGTLITTFVIAYGSFTLGQLGYHSITQWKENLIFGGLIAATDPVATLATFKKFNMANAQPLLNTLVLGEAILNDAVAITVFATINHAHGQQDNADLFLVTCKLMASSVMLGIFCSSCGCLILRLAHLGHSEQTGVLFIFASAYFTYALAQSMDCSGIVSNLTSGIVYRLYGSQFLSVHGKSLACALFGSLAALAETSIFIIVGTSVALINSSVDASFCLFAIVLVFSSRLVSVACCSGVSNGLKHWREDTSVITLKHQLMIWLSGLRGGIAVVCALEINRWCSAKSKSNIICATFLTVVVTLLLCGSTTEPMLVALGLAPKDVNDEDSPKKKNLTGTLLEAKGPQSISRAVGRHLDNGLQWLLVGGPRLCADDFPNH